MEESKLRFFNHSNWFFFLMLLMITAYVAYNYNANSRHRPVSAPAALIRFISK